MQVQGQYHQTGIHGMNIAFIAVWMFPISFKLVMFTLIVINTVFDVYSATVWGSDVKPSALCSFCESPCMANRGHGGFLESQDSNPEPFFPRSPLRQCAAMFALAEICKWNYFTYVQISKFTLYTKIRINISCVHVALVA